MKKLFISFCLLLTSCSTIKHIQVKTETIYRQIDSIAWHDSTIYHYIPVEKVVDIVPTYDTLSLETSIAKATAFVDTTTHTLKGSIENKKDSLRTIIKWKEKITVRDSVVIKEIPVEVPVIVKKVPVIMWYILGYAILTIIYFGLKIYLKIKL